ncbi:hypothetical protein MPSEU_000484300 [Mayamaea pseudoterrestris]|nr:hypothetical protein MPSEU_000484300 [Mayamaea pseudoterrestris]
MSSTPLYVSNPEQWLDETVKGDMVGLVIFRGSWCKFDRYYLRKLGQFIKHKRENGEAIKLIAWTSGGAQDAKKADEEWGLTKDCGYSEVIGDETAALAKYMIEDELLPNLVIVKDPKTEANLRDLPNDSYPNGLVMAGQVWWAHRGTVCFEWTSKVEPPSYGGPYRPDPAFVFEQVQKRKHALEHGNAVMPAHGNDLKMCAGEMEVNAAGCSIL